VRAVMTLATALVVAALGIPGRPASSAPAAHDAAPATEAPRVAKGPKLTVDVAKGTHRISRLIYGVNFAERGFANQVDLPNKATSPARTKVVLRHAAGARNAKGYQYAGAGLRRLGGLKVRHHAVRLTLPALSVTLIRVALRP
jgi:hypothetical protein